jgi:hypothetical protein
MTYGPRNRLLVLSRAGTWVVLFMGRTKHDILARPEAQHDTINFGSCRHDTNARVVSCLVSRHDERHGTARHVFWVVLGPTRYKNGQFANL